MKMRMAIECNWRRLRIRIYLGWMWKSWKVERADIHKINICVLILKTLPSTTFLTSHIRHTSGSSLRYDMGTETPSSRLLHCVKYVTNSIRLCFPSYSQLSSQMFVSYTHTHTHIVGYEIGGKEYSHFAFSFHGKWKSKRRATNKRRYEDPLNIKILYNTKGKQTNNHAKIIII